MPLLMRVAMDDIELSVIEVATGSKLMFDPEFMRALLDVKEEARSVAVGCLL